jgi:hypothetical protein
MATEMARRIQVGVTVVIALAGSRAEEFGEPRLIRNAWVVPIGRLAEWLESRPPAGIVDVQRLGVLVRTEFPSTTTDWQLLAAMGKDLDRQGQITAPPWGVKARHPQPSSKRRRRSRSRPAAPRSRKSPARGSRGGIVARRLFALVLVGALWWSTSTGAIVTASTAFSSWFAARVLASVGASSAPTGDAALGCDAFDPTSARDFRKFALVAHNTGNGCEWRATTKAGSVGLLRIEDRSLLNPMAPRFIESRKAGAAVVSSGTTADGRITVLNASEGTAIKRGKTTVPATRDLEVWVAHEALGLSAKQGQQLAVGVAQAVSRPLPTATSTP